MDEITEFEKIRKQHKKREEEKRNDINFSGYEDIHTKNFCPSCQQEIIIRKLTEIDFEVKLPCQCEIDRRKKEEEEVKAAQHRYNVAQLHSSSGLSREQYNFSFETFKQREGTEKVYKAFVAYSKGFSDLKKTGTGLLILGNTGNGKTHLCLALANKLIEQEYSVNFWNVPMLFHKIQSSFNGGNDLIFDDCLDCNLLILDDLGSEKPSEWTQTTINTIINARIENLKPTIITSNLTFLELSKALDARTISRLSEKSKFPQVVNSATDYRREHK